MASWAKALPRLQIQNLATGVSRRRITASWARSMEGGNAAPVWPFSVWSTAAARRSASAVAASLSSARSASTAFISGWSIKGLPKAWRWAVWCKASDSAWRISPAVPRAQSRRVNAPMARICGTPLPTSPTSQAWVPSNSTSELALAWLPSLCFRRWMCSGLTVPSGRQRGRKKQLRPPAEAPVPKPSVPVCAWASTRNASHMGAEKNHLCPVSR